MTTPTEQQTTTTIYTQLYTNSTTIYDFALNCFCSVTIISCALILKFSSALVGDICDGLTVSAGLELRDCSSCTWPIVAVLEGMPPESTYWERSAWKDGTLIGDLAAHGRPSAGLNMGGKGSEGQKDSPAATGGMPRWLWSAKSGMPGCSIGCMNGPASRPIAFSRLRHFARRFWNQTWNEMRICY